MRPQGVCTDEIKAVFSELARCAQVHFQDKEAIMVVLSSGVALYRSPPPKGNSTLNRRHQSP